MVLRLGAALDMPLREANELLQAAGLAPAYPEADVQAPALEPFRRAMDRLLAAHEPFWCSMRTRALSPRTRPARLSLAVSSSAATWPNATLPTRRSVPPS